MTRRTFIKLLFSIAAAGLSFAGMFRWLVREPGTSKPPEQPDDPLRSRTTDHSSSTEPGEALLSFMVLSDTHVNSAFSEQSDKFRKALDDISAFEPAIDMIAITGDITDTGIESDYREYNKILNDYKSLPPIQAVMGNHDYYGIWIDADGQWNKKTMPNGKSDAYSRMLFKTQFGLERLYYDFYVKGHHFIVLSQETYVQEKPEVSEGAWFSDEQLAWFQASMESHQDGSPVFVMIHQPLPEIGQDGGSGQLIRAKQFRAIVEPYENVFVFSGHDHRNFSSKQSYTPETFHWFHNASVGRTRPLSTATNKPTSQGLYVQVFADRVILNAREFMDRTWIKEANWTIPLIRHGNL